MSRWTPLQAALIALGLTALPISAQDNPWRTNAAVDAAPMPRAKHGSMELELRFDLSRAIPVQPLATVRIEANRTPIRPPIQAGLPAPICEEPPSDREVLQSLPPIPRGVPGTFEIFRDDVVVVKNRKVDRIDPPRMFPLVGAAQLHHCHWECAVYFRETIQIDVPFPVKSSRQRVEIVYIDKDFLHLFASAEAKESCVADTSAPARLTGTWCREMPGLVSALNFKNDELTITVKMSGDGSIATATLTAEYAVTKDGTVHGVFTGADVDVSGNTDNLGLELAQLSLELQALVDQPFALRCRSTEGGLMVSNVRFPEPKHEMLVTLGGKYAISPKGTIPSPKVIGAVARGVTEPSFPERYNPSARAVVIAPFGVQVANGSIGRSESSFSADALVLPAPTAPSRASQASLPNSPPPEVQAMMFQSFGQMLTSPVPPLPTPIATAPPMPLPVSTSSAMPKGTWVREVGALRYKLELKDNHLTATVTFSEENEGKVVSVDHVLTVDCYPTRDGSEVVGLITGFDMTTSGMGLTPAESRELMKVLPALQKALGEKPIAFTFRLYDDALVIGNVRFPSIGGELEEMTKAFEGMAGRYKANVVAPVQASNPPAEIRISGTNLPQYFLGVPTLPMPPPIPLIEGEPAKKVNPFRTGGQTMFKLIGSSAEYSSDPNVRMKQLLKQSEDLRQIGQEWRRFWFNDQPSHMTPERIHGGII